MSHDAEFTLTDVNGEVHQFTKSKIDMMIVAGWVFYIGSICFNYIFYKMHPSFTDISGAALKKKIMCYSEKNMEDHSLVWESVWTKKMRNQRNSATLCWYNNLDNLDMIFLRQLIDYF